MKTNKDSVATRRQWGGDRRTDPLSALPPRISEARITIGRLILVATICGWLAYFATWLVVEFVSPVATSTRSKVEAVAYLLIVTMLTASAIAYLVCRLGFFYRSRDHQRVPRAALDQFYAATPPSLTVIVPSYKEQERVIRTTLLSAALQEYADLQVVLLVDDPPNPKKKADRELLRRSQALPRQLEELLEQPHLHAVVGLDSFLGAAVDRRPGIGDMASLADCYDYSVTWLKNLAARTEIVDHSDRFFVDHVVLSLAADFAVTGSALRSAIAEEVILPRARLVELYQRLVRVFDAKLTSFERKRYASLSHEANKAMNLNSYIGLMGGAYRDVETVHGRVLVASEPSEADLIVRDPDYVLTLDADSILLPEYCLRLVHLMEQSQHEQTGVMQTPYSSYPGAATRLERIAGASTDLQHIVHQGMTHYAATFWVGANAVLRKRALDEIRETSYMGNWPVHRYIQDHTVIEDTESTIDLRTHGWQLYNYPERLSYSATPPDFGSLCIQRRRWANGGLLILSKLRKQRKVLKEKGQPAGLAERALRLNYMASICWSSFALLLLLAYPFRNDLVSPFLGLIALPYFLAQASDLRLCGYKRNDILRIYGFNLVLLPVNLSGVMNSIVQGLTGDKSVFGRTPKVRDRTVPNFLFIFTPYLVVGLAAYTLVRDYEGQRWDNLVYATINTVLASYAIIAFIGIRHSIADSWVHLKARLYKPVKTPKPASAPNPAAILASQPLVDWTSVLHIGDTNVTGGPRPGALAALDTPRLTGNTAWFDGFNTDMAGAEFRTVFQPIVDFTSQRTVGYEVLSRFDDGVPADRRLEELDATAGVKLDLLLARAGSRAAQLIPSDCWVSLNVSVDLLTSGPALPEVLASCARPVVLEVAAGSIGAVEQLKSSLAGYPEVSLALTGVAATYDSLTLVSELAPRYVKLERSWVTGLHADPARQALVSALITVARDRGSYLIAEGIEQADEVEVLRQLGVELGQGFFIGRPSRQPALIGD